MYKRQPVVPDTLSRLFAFDHQQQFEAPQLAPICRNVPEDPALYSQVPQRPYQVSADRLDNLQPVQSDRELFAEKSVYISATNVFETINRDILREKQALEYGTYVDYLTKGDAPLPDNETTTSRQQLPCRTILYAMGCYLNRICQATSRNAVRFVTN